MYEDLIDFYDHYYIKESRLMKDRGRLNELMLCVDAFAVAMKQKLLQKHNEGYYGWDEQENFIPISESLLAHAQRQVENLNFIKEEVDIANLAMMIWYLRKGR